MMQTGLPIEVPLPFDVHDPVQVAVAWSGIIEPGDPAARILINLLGEVEALRWVFSAAPGLPQQMGDGDSLTAEAREKADGVPWQRVHQRWHPRAAVLDVENYLQMARSLGTIVVAPGTAHWPERLALLEDREPLALWVRGRGQLAQLNMQGVALVGARASSSYGNRIAETFAHDVASGGYTVISGGAYGIDTAAHRGALSAHEAAPRGIAVLCGGVGNLYPAGNDSLFTQLMYGGLLVSEVPPNWRPARWRFLERNRVIAALSHATVVVEAGIRSGALATANRAVDLGVPVGVVPGPITSPASAGAHQLLREGAQLVTSSDDVFALMRGDEPGELHTDRVPVTLTQTARIVWSAFPTSRIGTARQLALDSGLAPSEVDTALLEMQMRGLVRLDQDRWVRAE